MVVVVVVEVVVKKEVVEVRERVQDRAAQQSAGQACVHARPQTQRSGGVAMVHV